MRTGIAFAVRPPHTGPSDGRLGLWKSAVKALPIMEALQPPLANVPQLWTAQTGNKTTPLIIATRNNVSLEDFSIGPATPGRPEGFVRLNDSTAIAAIRVLWPSTAITEVMVLGPEAIALNELKPMIRTKADITAFHRHRSGDTATSIRLACDNAALWCWDMDSGLKTYISGNEPGSLPRPCIESVCGINPKSDARQFRRALLTSLKIACDAYTIAYILNCAAKLLQEAELACLSAIAELGTANVGRYKYFSTAIAQVDSGRREKIVGKIIKLVGPGAADEVRNEFMPPGRTSIRKESWIPKGAFTLIKKKVTGCFTAGIHFLRGAFTLTKKKANPPASSMVMRTSAPQARPRKHHPAPDARIVKIQKELAGYSVPPAFIAKCLRMGMTDPEKIHDRYDSTKMHPGAIMAASGIRRKPRE